MKRLFSMFIACALFVGAAQAQTVVSRKIISAQKGNDEGPLLVQAAPGKYAVVWSRAISDSGEQLFSRGVNTNGSTAGAIHNNLVGVAGYRFTGHGVAALNGGGFIVAETRLTDRQLILRSFNSSFAPQGTTVASGITGYSPRLVRAGAGFLMVSTDGFIQSFVSLLDESGKKSSDPARVVPPTAANGFVSTRILSSPAAGFLVVGEERSADGSKGRASSFFVLSNLTSFTKPLAHETAFQDRPVPGDAAFDGQNALMLFGHAISDTNTPLSSRLLGTKGQNAGGIKKFNTGSTVFSRFLKIVSLSGLDKYAAVWEDLRGGLYFVQVLTPTGAAVSEPFPLSPNQFSLDGAPDLVWDSTSQTLLAAWTEVASQPAPHRNIWFGTFKID